MRIGLIGAHFAFRDDKQKEFREILIKKQIFYRKVIDKQGIVRYNDIGYFFMKGFRRKAETKKNEGKNLRSRR